MECFLCEKNENLLIKEFKHWTVLIHKNQCYLGRCMIKLNRHLVDLFDINQEEWDEVFEITKKLRDVLKGLFHPDLFNYASLGNVAAHLHIHVIPRYKDKREFEGIDFFDKRWGDNYSPYDRDFEIPDNVFEKLRESIREKL
jgi:diadenosine tetraphosphate (Ap4A) HIT family hydrolase